jgi:hypothetical protein
VPKHCSIFQIDAAITNPVEFLACYGIERFGHETGLELFAHRYAILQLISWNKFCSVCFTVNLLSQQVDFQLQVSLL